MHTADSLLAELRTVAPGAVAGVGDNVLDCYVHEHVAYPGGNALNVAAYSALLFGSRAAYTGIVGNDRFADHLLGVLDAIGVQTPQVRHAVGANGMAFVALDGDGDRRFVGSNHGGVQHRLRLRLTEHDLDQLGGFGSVHTSAYSSIDDALPQLSERTNVSFDFSTERDPDRIARIAPSLSVGFFSGEGLSSGEVDALGAFAIGAGCSSAVVTLGSRGARAFEGADATSVAIRPVEAVDTLGAGDAFITGYLAARDAGADLAQRLQTASASGAVACLYRGAFGYAVDAGEDALAQMSRVYET
ncbi:PfkB family carbohydrate kinase [Leifsonia sp. NPDC058292]|uniref:PfkB family carbohydrate kinase n=1 Tax=Leifsonia sp. NPDC058292 TaxID=3346428 RepID=UPI0036D829C6